MGRPSSLQKCYTFSVSWLNLPSLFSKCPHHKVQFFPDFKHIWLCESLCLWSTASVCGKAFRSFMKLFPFCFLWVNPWVGKSTHTLVSKKKGSTLRTTWAWQTVFTKQASVHTNLSQCTLLMSMNPGMPTLLETPLPASSWEPWLFWHMGRQGKSIEE